MSFDTDMTVGRIEAMPTKHNFYKKARKGTREESLKRYSNCKNSRGRVNRIPSYALAFRKLTWKAILREFPRDTGITIAKARTAVHMPMFIITVDAPWLREPRYWVFVYRIVDYLDPFFHTAPVRIADPEQYEEAALDFFRWLRPIIESRTE